MREKWRDRPRPVRCLLPFRPVCQNHLVLAWLEQDRGSLDGVAVQGPQGVDADEHGDCCWISQMIEAIQLSLPGRTGQSGVGAVTAGEDAQFTAQTDQCRQQQTVATQAQQAEQQETALDDLDWEMESCE